VFVRDKDDRLDEVVIALRSNEVAEAARCAARAVSSPRSAMRRARVLMQACSALVLCSRMY
jgi:hypothetical protein